MSRKDILSRCKRHCCYVFLLLTSLVILSVSVILLFVSIDFAQH